MTRPGRLRGNPPNNASRTICLHGGDSHHIMGAVRHS